MVSKVYTNLGSYHIASSDIELANIVGEMSPWQVCSIPRFGKVETCNDHFLHFSRN